MAPDTAGRRPGGGGVPDDALGGGTSVPTIPAAAVTAVDLAAWRCWTWRPRHRCGCSRPADCLVLGPRGARGLAAALDHLDAMGLCACWVAPRRHRSAA